MGLVWLILAGALAAVILAAVVSHWVGRHGAGPLLWRFVSGHHLDGKWRTDAGWLRPGTRVIHVTGHASRWAHWPRYRRAAVRLAVLAVTAGAVIVAAVDVRALAVTAVMAGLVLLAVSAVMAAVRLRDRKHYYQFVRPLHRSLRDVAGHPAAIRPGQWLSIPRDFATRPDATILVRLPENYQPSAGAKKRLLEITTGRLGIDPAGADVSWALAGAQPRAIITLSPPPPATVGLGSIRAVIESAPEHAPVLGVGRAGRVISADLDNDSPHILVSAATGGGKSTIVRALASQMLHHGGLLLVADFKRGSHPWARGLDSVGYAREVPEIAALLIAAAAEVTRRNALVDELCDVNGDLTPEDQALIGPRILLVIEEVNATAAKLARWWQATRTPDDPRISPAVEGLGDLLFMGRAVRMHVLGVAQSATARALGGPEMRENFSTRILARATRNAWKMLAPEVSPPPPPSRHPGRVHVVAGGTATECQVLDLSGADARRLATSGTVARFGDGPDWLSGASYVLPRVSSAIRTQDSGEQEKVPTSAIGPDMPGTLGLAAACATGVLSISLPAASTARQRDPEFPRPVSMRSGEALYLAGALAAWERNRPGRKEDSGGRH